MMFQLVLTCFARLFWWQGYIWFMQYLHRGRQYNPKVYSHMRGTVHHQHLGFRFVEWYINTLWVTVVCVLDELHLAMEKGYVVEEIYEAWHFTERSTQLFREFLQPAYVQKVQASGTLGFSVVLYDIYRLLPRF